MCNTEKTKTSFGKKKSTKDGLQVYCKDCRSLRTKKYRDSFSEERRKEVSQYQKDYKRKNLERIKERKRESSKIYRKKNRDKILAYNKKYRKRNRLKRILRKRIWDAFNGKGWEKVRTSRDLLGCSFEEAKEHIEGLWKEGMTWDNHTTYGWHIDHIVPFSKAKTFEEMERLCHYKNLQPLWWHENLSKGSK